MLLLSYELFRSGWTVEASKSTLSLRPNNHNSTDVGHLTISTSWVIWHPYVRSYHGHRPAVGLNRFSPRICHCWVTFDCFAAVATEPSSWWFLIIETLLRKSLSSRPEWEGRILFIAGESNWLFERSGWINWESIFPFLVIWSVSTTVMLNKWFIFPTNRTSIATAG